MFRCRPCAHRRRRRCRQHVSMIVRARLSHRDPSTWLSRLANLFVENISPTHPSNINKPRTVSIFCGTPKIFLQSLVFSGLLGNFFSRVWIFQNSPIFLQQLLMRMGELSCLGWFQLIYLRDSDVTKEYLIWFLEDLFGTEFKRSFEILRTKNLAKKKLRRIVFASLDIFRCKKSARVTFSFLSLS